MITIRAARPDESADIVAVHRAAFGPEYGPGVGELAARIMASGLMPAEWSIVAEDESGAVLGSVLVSYCELIGPDGSTRPIPVLSPVGVIPERHGEGIGAALVREAIERVDEAGEAALLVEGDWRYYRRFGFVTAEDHGILRPREDIPREAFQLIVLSGYDASLAGRVAYSAPFDAVET